jgi:hypothetical protein
MKKSLPLVLILLIAIAFLLNATYQDSKIRQLTESVKLMNELLVTKYRAADYNPVTSKQGTNYYSQGGIVINGIAYFTAPTPKDKELTNIQAVDYFPYVIAFDTKNLKKIKTYSFDSTYDSTPFYIEKKDKTPLILAHEYKQMRTKAINVKTGNIEWISKENQPGKLFFGYSYYKNKAGINLVLKPSQNGLHALSAEDGSEVWFYPSPGLGSITPAVDQKQSLIYYQSSQKISTLDAETGKIINSVSLPKTAQVVSWNTMLIDDENGYYIATYWYEAPAWGGTLRIFDKNLNLVWIKEKLPTGKKTTLTYNNGKIIIGSGNTWTQLYTGDGWKKVSAFSIKDGTLAWETDLKNYGYLAIYNVIAFNGSLYAETQDRPGFDSLLFKLNETDGKIQEIFNYHAPHNSCAPSLIADGKFFSGNLFSNRVEVTRLSKDIKQDWPGAFGDPQLHHNSVSPKIKAYAVKMKHLNQQEP